MERHSARYVCLPIACIFISSLSLCICVCEWSFSLSVLTSAAAARIGMDGKQWWQLHFIPPLIPWWHFEDYASAAAQIILLTLARAHTYTEIFYDKKCAVYTCLSDFGPVTWHLLVSCIIKGQFAVCTFSRCHQLFRIKVLTELCIFLIFFGWGL